MIQDFDEVNTVWTWTCIDKNYQWKLVHLKNLKYGDTDSAYVSLDSIPDIDSFSIDEKVEIADTIGETVNDSFPEFCMHAFNCPAERNGIIQTARETVVDVGFFLTKKRYALHVIDDEGKRVDKVKIVGLEVKKSDTSIAVKRILNGFINMILEDKDRDSIMEYIGEMAEEFKNLPASDISTPISVNTLKECYDTLEATGSKKGFPYQVRAAMFWNDNCTPVDKKVFPGEKVGLLYINNKDSKYIAFPIDMTIFPEWFEDFVIDYDTEWEKAHKKITNYLEAMGWSSKAIKKAIREDLFGF